MMGILDPAIAQAFDIEVAMIVDDERRKEATAAELRQLEVLAAATNVTLETSVVESLGGGE